MAEANVQVGKKPNGQEYHGRDRRLPENAVLRRAVLGRLIAYRRIRDIEAKEGEKKQSGDEPVDLLDW